MRLGGVCRDNGRILLANLFQGSRSTFSCVSFPSVFCLPSRHVGHIHFDALLNSPTVSGRFSCMQIFRSLHSQPWSRTPLLDQVLQCS